MQITFNTPQEQSDFEDFCERLCEHLAMDLETTSLELLREMQDRGLTFE